MSEGSPRKPDRPGGPSGNRPGGGPGSGPGGSGGTGGDGEKRRGIMPLFLILAMVVLGFLMLGQLFQGNAQEIRFGDFYKMLEIEPNSPLIEVTRVGNDEFRGTLDPNLAMRYGFVANDGKPIEKFRTTIATERLPDDLEARIVGVVGRNYKHEKANTLFSQILLGVLPWVLLLFLFWFFFLRRIGSAMGGGGVLNFGKSKAKMHSKESVNVTFKDVAGIEEARSEVNEIIEFLRNPEKFSRMGGRIPRGVMLIGPPGCGKTLLAKAVAGEAGVPFFSISGSDFVEMFVGVGASRVRDLFKNAKDNSPCIIFLDEIDAVGRRRGTGLGGGHDEREQTLNAILVEMDGFETDSGIIVFAATNRPDVLDPALLRPGRFDRSITIDLPDIKGREQIIRVHAAKVKTGPDFDPAIVARGTPGFSGAELANLVNEAAIIAVLQNKEYVDMECFEEARDKVKWGPQKKSRVMPEHEVKVTAYHEAGHALLQHLLPNADPLYKVTVVPRGPAGGATMSLPKEDRHYYSRGYLDDMLTVLYGGRIAEDIFFNDVTTGASNDIKRATELARNMVCEWGMSDAIGPLNYSDSEEHMFLGREIARTTHHSEDTARIIDQEVRRIASEAEKRARELIESNRERVEALAQALIKYETLMADEIAHVLEDGTVEDFRAKKEANTPKPTATPTRKPSKETSSLPTPKALLDGPSPSPA